MTTPLKLYTGVMSGTSLDAVDVAFAWLSLSGPPDRPLLQWRLVGSAAVPYPADLRRELAGLRSNEPTTIAQVCDLHWRLGAIYADAIRTIAADHDISLRTVSAIGLHGQTVWHAPPSQTAAERTGTLQLGQAAVVCEQIGVPVVSDFRAMDVAAGGEGAPLVPFSDWLLLGSADEDRVMLNLGGIANITYLPKGGALADVIAFDTGPGNMVIDQVAKAVVGAEHDEAGQAALSGKPDFRLLAELLEDPYFEQDPPKSTGAEHFGPAYARQITQTPLSPADQLATATELTAASVATAMRRWLPAMPARVIVGGGGVHNEALMGALFRELHPATIETHDVHGIPSKSKEALAFAILAAARMEGIPANLPRVTGAAGPRLLGTVTG